jgi:ribonucleoside-diphosphate reductase alpha chain
MANAPTATTANIAGCYPTIEPIYKNIYVKSNMAGDFMLVNEYLVDDLKKLGLWNADMLEKIKFYDGSVQEIAEIPPALRAKYKEAFEIEPQWLIKAAAYRGRWIDQSQSLNIFYGGTSGKMLSDIYQYAWDLGLKTTYYLRTLGASRVEKSTVDLTKFGNAAKGDTAVQSQGIVASGIIVEEMVAVVTRDGPEASVQSVPSPMSVGEVAAIVEAKQMMAGQLDLLELAKRTPAASNIPEPAYESQGIPSFGEKIVVVPGKRVEIVGEICESCSA